MVSINLNRSCYIHLKKKVFVISVPSVLALPLLLLKSYRNTTHIRVQIKLECC